MDYTHCNIYIYSELHHQDFLHHLEKMLDGRKERNTIITPYYEAYVEENDFFDKVKSKDAVNGFIYYPYIIELEIKSDKRSAVDLVNNILETLWKDDLPAVPTCNFEEELLNYDGHINRKGIPKVK